MMVGIGDGDRASYAIVSGDCREYEDSGMAASEARGTFDAFSFSLLCDMR